MPSAKTDYLAIIPIGGGSSWGRSPDKDEAIQNAINALKDWQGTFDVSSIEVIVNVIDVQGYSTCSWTRQRLLGVNEATGEEEPVKRDIEHVKMITPNWGSKKRS